MNSIAKVVLGIGWTGMLALSCTFSESSPSSGGAAVSNGAADPNVAGGKDNDAYPTIFDARTESAGSHCAAGGVALLSGPDKNRNGKLDSGEVTATRYVCNGINGAQGPAGANGAQGAQGTAGPMGAQGTQGVAGAAGKNSLVTLTDEPAGAACATGGKKVSVGLDANDNGTLDASEIAATQYVCNGAAGAPGQNGKASLVNVVSIAAGGDCATGGQAIYVGTDANGNGVLDPAEAGTAQFVCNGAEGPQGSTGDAGAAGLTALVVQVVEPLGANCASGGTKIKSGLDANTNGTLDAVEITGTSYVCNGGGAGHLACNQETFLSSYPFLMGCELVAADLHGADLTNADLSGADLRGADLTFVTLEDADLRNADLSGADLTNADLVGANLTNADLAGANLTNADLRGANLTNADLAGANLTSADLGSANLTNANLTNANLSFAQVFIEHSGVIWSNTICPNLWNSDDFFRCGF